MRERLPHIIAISAALFLLSLLQIYGLIVSANRLILAKNYIRLLLWLMVAVIYILTAIGFFRLKLWAMKAVYVISLFQVVFNFLAAFQTRSVKSLFFLVIYGIIFVVINTQTVKSEFED